MSRPIAPFSLAFISAHLSASISSHVNSFSFRVANLYVAPAPFAQHFHYASRAMMRSHELCRSPQHLPSERRVSREASVNATQFGATFPRCTYSSGLCLRLHLDSKRKHDKRRQVRGISSFGLLKNACGIMGTNLL